jgi:putative ABC transport system ATP-binding protein
VSAVQAPVVAVRGLKKHYDLGEQRVNALAGVDLTIEHGEFVAIMGPSGSGKSTFMHISGLLDRPTGGTYSFEGLDVARLSDDQLADLRSRRLGFVFQAYNLLPRTTALENVELPMVYAGVAETVRRKRALEALSAVGLSQVRDHNPNQLSGGQQQRVAIARSIVNDPALILADEPTGALDSASSEDVMRLFERLNEERGMTILLVTHEAEVARHAKRIVTFRDGLILSDRLSAERRTAAEVA